MIKRTGQKTFCSGSKQKKWYDLLVAFVIGKECAVLKIVWFYRVCLEQSVYPWVLVDDVVAATSPGARNVVISQTNELKKLLASTGARIFLLSENLSDLK